MLGWVSISVILVQAANGAEGTTAAEVAIEYRSICFSVGGNATLEESITLPSRYWFLALSVLRQADSDTYTNSLEISFEKGHNQRYFSRYFELHYYSV